MFFFYNNNWKIHQLINSQYESVALFKPYVINLFLFLFVRIPDSFHNFDTQAGHAQPLLYLATIAKKLKENVSE